MIDKIEIKKGIENEFSKTFQEKFKFAFHNNSIQAIAKIKKFKGEEDITENLYIGLTKQASKDSKFRFSDFDFDRLSKNSTHIENIIQKIEVKLQNQKVASEYLAF